MELPLKRILCPVDFNEGIGNCLATAAQLAGHFGSTVFVLHVIPFIIQPAGESAYVDRFKPGEEEAVARLRELMPRHLAAVKSELIVRIGNPPAMILQEQKRLQANLIIMATHGRRGLSRLLLGSVAEVVVRRAACPVLTLHPTAGDKQLVRYWMARNPVTSRPDEKLVSAQAKMRECGFRGMPVLDEDRLVGVITDRDLRRHEGYQEHTEVRMAMSENPITVSPSALVTEAARLLHDNKIGTLPVVEDDKLVGVIAASDILAALSQDDD